MNELEQALQNMITTHKVLMRYFLELLREGKKEEVEAALLEYLEG